MSAFGGEKWPKADRLHRASISGSINGDQHAWRRAIVILFLAWLISLFAGATVMTIGYLLVAALMVFGWRYNWTKYSGEYAEWDKKFICMRCSNVFKLAPGQDAAVMEQSQAA